MSVRDVDGAIIPTARWARKGLVVSGTWYPDGAAVLRWGLLGVGDYARERVFRMNVTLCLHRGVTEDEAAGLPAEWHAATSGMAGGPLEVLEERGVRSLPSARPCHNPEHVIIVSSRPDLWVPGDCGKCGPCVARASLAAT